MKELSVVIPIYNEAKNLKSLISEINVVKKKLKIKKFEVLFIDDKSKDGTKDILKKKIKKYSYLKHYVRQNKNKDLSKSCIAGFNKSRYKNILVMDGDMQHHPSYIYRIFKIFLNNKYDFVVGCRNFSSQKNIGLSFQRKLFSIILIKVINFLLGFRTKDPMSGFFIFKKKFFLNNKNNLFSRGYKILSDLIYSNQENIKVKDIFIYFDRRFGGKSKMSLKILLILCIFIIKKFSIKILNKF